MIEKIAIVVIAILGQLNITPENQNSIGFLNQSIKKETASEQFNLREKNQSYRSSFVFGEYPFQLPPSKIKGASSFNVNAKAAVVLDAGTNTILYFKNSDANLPIASLTKIMTALVVLENADLNEVVVISQEAFQSSGNKNNLAVGEKITVKNLLEIMLISSDNIAARALAEHTGGSVNNFVALMNKKADSIGLKNTRFLNPSGLDDRRGNNASTAYEVARLVDYALEKPLIWENLRIQKATVFSTDEKIKHNLKSTNLLLGKMKNIIGGKTGLTNRAGQCLALVIADPDNNHKIISVVLDADDRFLETEKLTKWTFENYQW